MTTAVERVEVHAGTHTYHLVTDTGWHFAWWALTQRGLIAQVRTALVACGVVLDTDQTTGVVHLARKHGYVTLGSPNAA